MLSAMMAQTRLRPLRLGDPRMVRIASWTGGLAVAAAVALALLVEPRLWSFLGTRTRVEAVFAAGFVPIAAGIMSACLINRGAMVLAFAAARRSRAIVLALALSAFAATMAGSELAGAGQLAEGWISGIMLGLLLLLIGILGALSRIGRDSNTVYLNLGAICGLVFVLWGLPAVRRRHHIPPLTVWSIAGQSLFALAVATICGWLVLQWTRGLAPRWQRLRAPAAAAAAGYPLFLLLANQLLGGVDEVGLLPILATLVVLGWRAMARSGRVAVRSAADTVGALGLGVVGVLTLVWLANVLDLPRTEVRAVQAVAVHLRDVIDVPWWLWALSYAALTGAYLAMALGSQWATRLRSWVRRVAAGVKLGHRTGTITGIVLMFAAFVAAVAPAAVAPVLAHRIYVHYTVSLAAQAEAEREQAVGEAVTRAFSAPNPAQLPVLRMMLTDIHAIDHPQRAGGGPTDTEIGLARQLGQIEGRVRVKATEDVGSGSDGTSETDAAAPALAVAARLAVPMVDTADLARRLATVQAQDEQENQRQQAADAAADLAASTITAVLDSVPLPSGIDRVEVVGLIRGYLQGLAESPIGEVFRAWTRRAAGGTGTAAEPALDAVALIEPNALQLEIESSMEYLQTTLDTDAGVSASADQRVQQERQQDPLLAAVDLANQTRFLRAGAGVCAGCSQPGDLYRPPEEPDEIRPPEPIK
jgi:hypothetical protein